MSSGNDAILSLRVLSWRTGDWRVPADANGPARRPLTPNRWDVWTKTLRCMPCSGRSGHHEMGNSLAGCKLWQETQQKLRYATCDTCDAEKNFCLVQTPHFLIILLVFYTIRHQIHRKEVYILVGVANNHATSQESKYRPLKTLLQTDGRTSCL